MIPGRGLRVARRRTMVGTAVGVAATASMVSNARRNRAERKAIENQTEYSEQPSDLSQNPDVQSNLTSQLEELSSLRNRGIITQQEFEAKKKQILNV